MSKGVFIFTFFLSNVIIYLLFRWLKLGCIPIEMYEAIYSNALSRLNLFYNLL
nr:MAG TPA: hypothetical protein [Caudoviricetes sp.]